MSFYIKMHFSCDTHDIIKDPSLLQSESSFGAWEFNLPGCLNTRTALKTRLTPVNNYFLHNSAHVILDGNLALHCYHVTALLVYLIQGNNASLFFIFLYFFQYNLKTTYFQGLRTFAILPEAISAGGIGSRH